MDQKGLETDQKCQDSSREPNSRSGNFVKMVKVDQDANGSPLLHRESKNMQEKVSYKDGQIDFLINSRVSEISPNPHGLTETSPASASLKSNSEVLTTNKKEQKRTSLRSRRHARLARDQARSRTRSRTRRVPAKLADEVSASIIKDTKERNIGQKRKAKAEKGQENIKNAKEGKRLSHVYGIPVKSFHREKTGRCEACNGACNGDIPKKSKGERILTCRGKGCNREYHLKCLVEDFVHRGYVTRGKFYCSDCDALGATRNLENYFDKSDRARSEFPSSRDFVEVLLDLHMGGGGINKRKWKIEQSSIALVKKLIPKDHSAEPTSSEDEPPESEISRVNDLYFTAMDDSNWAPREITSSSKECLTVLAPERLVGKTFRVYCNIDNTYHVGRIIDWRLATPPSKDVPSKLFWGKGKIGRTEFLVRFPAGINGRNKTFLKWLIFEEHCCAVSAATIYGARLKGRGRNGWRPAHLLLRTTLEVLPLRHLLRKDGHWGLVAFYGEESHTYMDLAKEAVDFHSHAFNEFRWKVIEGAKAQNNRFLNLAMSLANIEIEEQRRTFKWHTKYLENSHHKSALTLKDEYSMKPLTIDRKSGSKNVHERSRLCSLIQHGLDYQYISEQIAEEDDHRVLDVIESISFSTTRQEG